MGNMKDSGIEWIGMIPEEWDITRVKYLAQDTDSVFIDGDWIESDIIVEAGVRYLTTGNVGAGYFKEQGSGYITEETFKKLNCLKVLPGDLMISRLNEPIGRACIVPDTEEKYVVAVDNVILRPDKNYNKKYIMYCMNTDGYANAGKEAARGATMQRVSRTLLGGFYVPVASEAEQQLIADFLDDKVSKIDDILSDLRKQVNILEKYKQSVITEAVTKGLNPNVKMKDSGIDWVGEIPEEWEVTKIKYLLNSLNSGTPVIDENLNDDKPFLVYGGGKPLGECSKYNIEDTIVIGRVGANCGCVTRIYNRAWATDNALIVDTTQNIDYIFYILNALHLNDLNTSTAQPLITSSKVMNVKIPFTFDITEQQQIADYLDDKCAQIDELIADKEAQIEKMEKYKKSMIYEYVTGKKRVKGV